METKTNEDKQQAFMTGNIRKTVGDWYKLIQTEPQKTLERQNGITDKIKEAD